MSDKEGITFYLFSLFEECILRKTGLDLPESGVQIGEKKIKNLRDSYDTI